MSDKKDIIILSLIPIALVSAFLSFKMHLNLFKATGKSNSFFEHDIPMIYCENCKAYHPNITNLKDLFNVILNAGVCPLGKVGGWFIILWSIILFTLILVYRTKDYEEKKDVYKKLGIVQLSFTAILFAGTLANLPLLARSIPFFALSATVGTLLVKY
jgi:hypothetical protein